MQRACQAASNWHTLPAVPSGTASALTPLSGGLDSLQESAPRGRQTNCGQPPETLHREQDRERRWYQIHMSSAAHKLEVLSHEISLA